ncbi:unnamed protein product [Owenia fusiformis]|uniref:Beta-hexosaminidase bacterial type N-terminal domain-containing protein n=1 Tax=Owenia fusiformis TaxID=6347 RepID=A0A8J1XY21_OWEFU|nr:unnamed protein product [Owenia fusiformis]
MMHEAVESLQTAIKSNRTDIVRSILSAYERGEIEEAEGVTLHHVLNFVDEEEGTLLHLATKLDQPDTIRTLLSSGSDPGIHDEAGKTPFDCATSAKVQGVFNEELLQSIATSNVGRVCQLVAAGVDVNLCDTPKSRNTPLHWAASYGNKEVVQCLCARNADPNAVNSYGATPLHDAIMRGDVDIVEEILLSGADIHKKATSGKFSNKSPSDLAFGNSELVKVLEKVQPTKAASSQQVNGANGDSETSGADFDLRTPIRRQSSRASIESGKDLNNGHLGSSFIAQSSSEKLDVLMSNSCISTPPSPLVTDSRLHLVWPRPKKIIQIEAPCFKCLKVLNVSVLSSENKEHYHQICDLWEVHKNYLVTKGLTLNVEFTSGLQSMNQELSITCQVNQRLFKSSESYTVSVRQNMVRLLASDMTGMLYAINTFIQLISLCDDGASVPALQIKDWPCLKERSVSLDMSRGRIPKLDVLYSWVDSLSYLKVNHIHLYTRFKKPVSGPNTWQFCYSKKELLELSRYCAVRCVCLTPVLDIDSKVDFLDLGSLYGTFQEFLMCFANSGYLNIGPRLSSFLLDTLEEGTLCLEDGLRLLPISSTDTVRLCAHVFHDNLDLLELLPSNVVLMEYGFQAYYDFQKFAKVYSESNVSFCTCPGTAAWNSIGGCPEAAVANISNSIQSAISHEALGILICDWSGIGHMTHQPISWPGFLVAAGLSWNSDINIDFMHANLVELVNNHVFFDRGCVSGQVVIELGRAETYLLRCSRNQPDNDSSNLPAEQGSILHQLLTQPDMVTLEHLTPETFQKTMRHIRKCQSELNKADLQHVHDKHIVSELQLTADLMLLACRIGRSLVHIGKRPSGDAGCAVINLGVANLPATTKTDLANRLLGLIEQYKTLWTEHYLDIGLKESLVLLSAILKQCIPNQADMPAAHTKH